MPDSTRIADPDLTSLTGDFDIVAYQQRNVVDVAPKHPDLVQRRRLHQHAGARNPA